MKQKKKGNLLTTIFGFVTAAALAVGSTSSAVIPNNAKEISKVVASIGVACLGAAAADKAKKDE